MIYRISFTVYDYISVLSGFQRRTLFFLMFERSPRQPHWPTTLIISDLCWRISQTHANLDKQCRSSNSESDRVNSLFLSQLFIQLFRKILLYLAERKQLLGLNDVSKRRLILRAEIDCFNTLKVIYLIKLLYLKYWNLTDDNC